VKSGKRVLDWRGASAGADGGTAAKGDKSYSTPELKLLDGLNSAAAAEAEREAAAEAKAEREAAAAKAAEEAAAVKAERRRRQPRPRGRRRQPRGGAWRRIHNTVVATRKAAPSPDHCRM